MNRYIHLILAGLVAGITALAPVGSSAETPLPGTKGARPQVVPGEILVKYSDKASHAVRQNMAAKLGGQQEELDLYGDLRRVRLPEGKTIAGALRELRGEWAVEYAEPVYYRYRLACGDTSGQNCPDDELFGQQWAMHNDQDTDMDMPEAWNTETGESASTTGTSDIRIAIIDDGFDTNHPDLATPFGSRGTTCTDSGCSGSPDFQDQEESHGTAVAGAAGAEGNNAEGITGSARVAQMYPIRLENLTSAAIANAINHAVANDAHIINISLGGPSLSLAEQDAIENAEQKGVLIVAAAGNEDANAGQGTAYYPASVDLPNVLAVGATDEFQQVAGFSVWGPLDIEVAAPGYKVLTTQVDDTYGSTSGTSFASPFTAGVAALVGQDLLDNGADPANLDYDDLKARIMAGAELTNDNLTNELDSKLTGRFVTGRVNAYQALESTTALASRGPVMVLDDISVSDPTASGGDGDGQIDPGETASLVVSIKNINHEDPTGTLDFGGRLSVAKSPNAASPLSGDTPTATFTATGTNGTYTASFPLKFINFDGHQRFLAKLEIDHGNDGSFEDTRWAWQEAGRLLADNRLRQAIGRVEYGSSTNRTAWDDFHHFHFTATQDHQSLVFQTSTDHDAGMDSDIDLIVREGATPEYNITLNPPEGQSSFFVGPRQDNGELDASVRLSGRFDGEESVTFDNVTAGNTYEIVVVNFSQDTINYDLEAVTDPSQTQFIADTFTVAEGESATITVERLNPTDGGLTVEFQARVEDRFSNSASADEFDQVTGELVWEANEGGTKSFTVDTFDNLQANGDKAFQVALSMPSGTRAALGDTTTARVTIQDSGNTSEPDSGGSGGGGGGGPLAPGLLAMLALLGLRRRL